MSRDDEHVTPEESLVRIVGEPGLPALIDTAQAVVQNLVEEGVLDESLLKDFPLVGTLVKVIGVGRNVREQLFLKKLLAFYREVEQVGDETREQFVRDLSRDPRVVKRTGETMLAYLDRIIEVEKATLLGKFFCALVEQHITRATFDQLAWTLDRFFLQDGEGLRTLYEQNYPEPEVGARLANAGLANQDVIAAIGGTTTVYHINSLGKAFVEIGGLV